MANTVDSPEYCIYKLENIINGKMYIGQTKNLKHRKLTHRGKLKLGKHPNYKLQKDWSEFGESAFKYTVLEYCSKDIVNEREMYYISLFDSISKGYNISIGGSSGNNFPRKKIKQYDLDGNYIKTWESAAEAARFYNTNRALISHALKNHTTALGFQWCYENEEVNGFYQRSTQKSFAQYDLQGNLVCVYKTMNEITKKNPSYKKTNIWHSAKGRWRQTAYGYKWKEITKEEYYEYYSKVG